MSRNLLHIAKLEDFKKFLQLSGVEFRPGKGPYEILQVRCGNDWHKVYQRDHMPEHFTVQRKLDPLVKEFTTWRRRVAASL